MKRLNALLLSTLSLLFVFSGCSVLQTENKKDLTYGNYEFYSMNTVVSMSIEGNNSEKAFSAARQRTLELENKWSVTIDTSEVFAINSANGDSVTVSNDTLGLINFSLGISKRTSGAFEPTIYPIVKLWGFTTREFYVPTNEEIENALKFVGYEKVSLNGNEITLPVGMSLDFGAVGKGYALDEALTVLKNHEISSALVNFGGNIGLIGDKNGEPWKIGVKSPTEAADFGTLYLSDCAIATSGNYQRYFEDENGKRYGHIMNPLTGTPMESDILSVTVVAKDGKVCDALATAIYVMGIEKAFELYRHSTDFELLILDTKNTVYLTEGLSSVFTLDNDSFTVNMVKREVI